MRTYKDGGYKKGGKHHEKEHLKKQKLILLKGEEKKSLLVYTYRYLRVLFFRQQRVNIPP